MCFIVMFLLCKHVRLPCVFNKLTMMMMTLHNRLFSEAPTVYPGKHIVLHHFHRSYSKANKVSKSDEIRKVEYAYHFWKCADAADRKLSKLVHACRNYSLPNLARFLWDTFFCVLSNILERIIIGRLSNHLERNIYTTLFTFRQN